MKKIEKKYFALKSTKFAFGASIVLILYVNFLIISAFMQFQSLESNLDNPLIPQEYISYFFAPYAKVGLILSVGLMLILLLKFLRQNLVVIIAAIALIEFYYLTDLSPGWNKQNCPTGKKAYNNISYKQSLIYTQSNLACYTL